MKKIHLGVQGDIGSTNERAGKFFSEKYNWQNVQFHYLISTENVLTALEKGEIDYGTFAWESSRSGLVEETQIAIQHHQYEKIDQEAFQLDHAIISNSPIDTSLPITIYSHQQALTEHAQFLNTIFNTPILKPEIDTAIAAKKLSENQYPPNCLVIAPIGCATIYNLNIHTPELPSNAGYLTTIFLAKRKYC